MSTFSNQDKLGWLPVPDLFETAEVYLASVRPLLTSQEYQWTQDSVADFIKPGGLGPQLHARLLAHAEEEQKHGRNWLEKWWLDYGYLRGRYPLPIELSCHLLWKDSIVRSKGVTQTQQAAKLLVEHMNWQKIMEEEKYPPQFAGSKPLCMAPYKTIFTSERQPGPEIDRLIMGKPKPTVVVMVKNQFYLLDLITGGRQLTPSEIEGQLQRIKEDAAASVPVHGVGSFTTMEREEWATIRANMCRNPTNQSTFDEITNCSLMLSLDNNTPWTEDEALALIAASGVDRWFDKIYGIIVFENGRAGAILEHTPCDAPFIASMVDAAGVEAAKKPAVEVIRPLSSLQIPMPKKLHFEVPQEHIPTLEAAAITHAKKAATKVYHNFHWSNWGSKFLKKAGVSPDTFLQLALQLGYYKAHQNFTATYESAHTRLFLNGRTECVRTLTSEVQDFVKTMESNAPVTTKYLLFKRAEATHKKQMSRAVQGRGCDRHFLGLKLIHATQYGGELPSVFQDPAMTKSAYFQMSTSNVPGRTFHGGFGNVVPDGYGCCYIISQDSFDISIVADATCTTTNVHKLDSALRKAFTALGAMLTEVQKAKL